MLSRLFVKNIALIEEANIEFDEKLNILSGETGSGKSVLLDSINFVLGSKADKSMIRYGENEATVRAEFCVAEDSLAIKALNELDIESDGEIIITRKYNVDGKGSIKINGNTVTLSMLKSVTSHLVDVHGQSEHFYLLNESNQLKVIDGLCGVKAEVIKDSLSDLIKEKKEILSKIKDLGGNEQERERALDLLNYQINEIKDADIKIGEFEELKSKQNIINNVERLLSVLNSVKGMFSDDGGCIDILGLAKRQIASISNIDGQYEKIYDQIESISAEADDLSDTISSLAEDLSFDEEEAQYVETRLSTIKALKKKYGADEEEILKFLQNAQEKFDQLNNSAEMIEKYRKKVESLDNDIYYLCRSLTEIRIVESEKLCKHVENELKTLNIPNAKIVVQFNDYDRATANLNSYNGCDEICFMFSANKGEPLKPLSKVISGGEMSRFMLALKTQLKGINGISTYIFDEIDAGISGVTAKSVAEKFIAISQNTQILAVSHLPQVCAASSAEFLIYKTDIEDKTITNVKRLSDEEKIEEIIRLTGGGNSEATKKHAIELIEQYK